jgi:hypothetical protein
MTVTDIENYILDVDYEINRLKQLNKRVYTGKNIDFGPMSNEFENEFRNFFSNKGYSVSLNKNGKSKLDILIQWM